jgi:A/G-specific adenine glycosylase
VWTLQEKKLNSKPHKALLNWFKKHGRHELPWRESRDVYHVLVSEIMLQQTQANRVAEYFYPQFLQNYPSLKHLAKAPLDSVLGSWSGLGYYSRARNLHKLAQICAEKGLPDCMEDLQKLPGIGPYTASAICSFAHEQAVSVVDTNIKRVLKRYFALEDEKGLIKHADGFLNHQNPRSHNLALMDLGSLVCTPKNPTCKDCPLSLTCKGKIEPERFTKTKKIQYENLELFLGVYVHKNRLALVKSNENLYKGLYILPQVEPIEENHMGSFKHSYTKYRIKVNLYKINFLPQKSANFSYEELQEAPISTLTKKALKFIKF